MCLKPVMRTQTNYDRNAATDNNVKNNRFRMTVCSYFKYRSIPGVGYVLRSYFYPVRDGESGS